MKSQNPFKGVKYPDKPERSKVVIEEVPVNPDDLSEGEKTVRLDQVVLAPGR